MVLNGMVITDETVKRFFAKVVVGENCWGWLGSTSKGYGQMSSRKRKSPFKAHRLSWVIHNGDIPKGLVVRHSCNNPTCVNPKHLKVGTQKDNADDMVKAGRMNGRSLLNLKPGQKGFYGAGALSNKQLGRT